MADIKSIEQLLYYMRGNINLSRYDEKFIDNIMLLQQVTTNQVILLHTLIYKYKRQFVLKGLNPDTLVDLPWNVTIVESNTQYTDGHVSIENNVIYFKCPFNRGFIDLFRKEHLNMFSWNKEKRHYEAPYNVHSLKILLNTANKFFQNIHFCPVTKQLLSNVKEYESAKYWQPTLIKRNDNLFIVATNAILDEKLGDITLSDDVETLAELSKFGINISEEFYQDDPKLKFICESNTNVEQSNIATVIEWLDEIKCDMVYLSGSSVINLTKKKCIEELQEKNMNFCDTSAGALPTDSYNYPVVIKFKKNFEYSHDPIKLAKIINVVNSQPVKIK